MSSGPRCPHKGVLRGSTRGRHAIAGLSDFCVPRVAFGGGLGVAAGEPVCARRLSPRGLPTGTRRLVLPPHRAHEDSHGKMTVASPYCTP
eukprot:1194576-Prorocentrum_minimum.AAC.14